MVLCVINKSCNIGCTVHNCDTSNCTYTFKRWIGLVLEFLFQNWNQSYNAAALRLHLGNCVNEIDIHENPYFSCTYWYISEEQIFNTFSSQHFIYIFNMYFSFLCLFLTYCHNNSLHYFYSLFIFKVFYISC